MRDGRMLATMEISRHATKSADFFYVVLSGAAGIWQGWCFSYGTNSFLGLIVMTMSLPFVALSFIYSLGNPAARIVEPPNWKRVLILWVGMPASLLAFALTVLAETGIIYLLGLARVNPAFGGLRLLIGEAAGCFVWAICLLAWARKGKPILSRNLLFAIVASLFLGVLLANGLNFLVLKSFHKDLYVYLVSAVTTMISAFTLVRLSGKLTLSGREGGPSA
jgi:hypothetical protein